MTLDCAALMNAAASHAAASGWFDRVNQHEGLNPINRGMSCDIWVDRMGPVPGKSALNSTAVRIVLTVRISSAVVQPMDRLDPQVMNAADALMRAYSGDFSLTDLVEYVDLLGADGVALDGRAGWVKQDGGTASRIFEITVPLVIRGLWDQAE